MSEPVQRAKKRLGREGNRWVNERPSGEEISKWFTENVPIDERLDAKNYVAGVTLIPTNEKSKEVVGWDAGNSALFQDVWDLVLTPYMRVETRVKYFHDLMALDGHLGVIAPVELPEQDPRLPVGFFPTAISSGPDGNKVVRYVGCTMKVTVYKKGSLKEEKVLLNTRRGEYEMVRRGTILLDGTPATKVVPVLSYDKPDTYALMKAETGAVGRALAMAGMLVIPGTGLASAEDVLEIDPRNTPTEEVAAELPDDFEPVEAVAASASEEELRESAKGIIEELGEFPPTLAEFKAWAKERGYERLSEVTSPALRGLVRKAENMLSDARKDAPGPGDVKPATADPLAE